jgi:hypothetical protein
MEMKVIHGDEVIYEGEGASMEMRGIYGDEGHLWR